MIETDSERGGLIVGLNIEYRRRPPFMYMTAFNPDLTDIVGNTSSECTTIGWAITSGCMPQRARRSTPPVCLVWYWPARGTSTGIGAVMGLMEQLRSPRLPVLPLWQPQLPMRR
jgi:hypothetical protein